MSLNFIFLFGILIIAFYTDIKRKTIPNWLTAFGIVFGLLYHTLFYGIEGLKSSFLSMAIGFSLFLVLYLFGAVGAGDVKLFGAIGALTNIEFVLQASVYSIIYAGIIGLIIVIGRKELSKRVLNVFVNLYNLVLTKNIRELKTNQKAESYHFPFMYAVLPSVLTVYYYYNFI